MKHMRRLRHVRAFTLIELLLVIAIVSLLISIMLPSLGRGRRLARGVICQSNMRQISTGLMNYASETKGWLGVFSWKPGQSLSRWPDLNNANAAFRAHANQAVDIARRVLGESATTQPAIADRMLSRNYSYMPLVDGGYLAEGLPNKAVACSEDRDTQIWQRNYVENPSNVISGTPDPDPAGSAAFHRFLAFWSTYQTVPAAWSDQTGPSALAQADTASTGYHLLYWWYPHPNQLFMTTRLDRVSFPSSKVYLFDLFDRHYYKRTLFHAYADARQPLAFFDGSVRSMRTGDANKGWDPRSPLSTFPTQYYYTPAPGEPRTLSGNASDPVVGYYRWTRSGIRGVDFTGGEVKR